MAVITNQTYRNELDKKGIRVASDLTKKQANMVAAARKEGKVAYFKRGKLIVGPKRDQMDIDASHRHSEKDHRGNDRGGGSSHSGGSGSSHTMAGLHSGGGGSSHSGGGGSSHTMAGLHFGGGGTAVT
jgi:hypothetical protein